MCTVPFKWNNVCVCRPTLIEKFTLVSTYVSMYVVRICTSVLFQNPTVFFSLHFLPHLLYCKNKKINRAKSEERVLLY